MKSLLETRSCSIEVVNRLGYEVSSNLPLLDSDMQVRRNNHEIARRLLCLHALVALSFDWEARKKLVKDWLHRENLWGDLSFFEVEFVVKEGKNAPLIKWRLEALFGLAWACRLLNVPLLDSVPDKFVFLFPSIAKGEATADFENKLALRERGQIVDGLDVLYCLDSAMMDRKLNGRYKENLLLSSMAVRQRRHALEWLISKEGWEDIVLDS